jgi:hypothetical protein
MHILITDMDTATHILIMDMDTAMHIHITDMATDIILGGGIATGGVRGGGVGRISRLEARR